jgi:hypothetical protein
MLTSQDCFYHFLTKCGFNLCYILPTWNNTAVNQPCYRMTYGCIIPLVAMCSSLLHVFLSQEPHSPHMPGVSFSNMLAAESGQGGQVRILPPLATAAPSSGTRDTHVTLPPPQSADA